MKLLVILLGTFLLPAEPIHSLLPESGRFKISGGLLLHWNVNAKDRSRDAIEAFDQYGVRVFGVNIYKLVPSARMVSIDDVAVLRNQSIAIAAVSRESNGQTRAWLLHLGWDGRVTHATQLDAAKSLGWLDFDEAGNIWGLTNYLGEKVRKDTIYNSTDCPVGPLVLVFNPEGKIVKSLLKQTDFPDGLREASDIGQVAFGLMNDRVWFWQPARHRMIITDREGREVRTVSIRHARTRNLGGQTLLLPTGEVIQDLHSPNGNVRGVYVAGNHYVKKYGQPQNAFLAGMDGSDLVFLRQSDTTGNFMLIRIRSLTQFADPGEARTARTKLRPPASISSTRDSIFRTVQ